MKNMKKLTLVGMIMALCSVIFMGCKDETDKKEKYLTYSEYAGSTVGYIVNASAVFIGPEVKTVITNVLGEIVTKLPKETTAETIATDLKAITDDAIKAMHVKEQYAELVNKSADTLLTLLQVGLSSIKTKHPVEFDNAEMFYTIAYTFFDSANSVLNISNSLRGDSVEEKAFEIADVTFDDIKDMAKDDGKKIPDDQLNEILNAIKAK